MFRLNVMVLMAVTMVLAQDKKATETEALAAKVKTLEQDARFSRLEKAALSQQIAKAAMDAAQQETQAAYAEACRGAGLKPEQDACVPDWASHKVVKPEPTKK